MYFIIAAATLFCTLLVNILFGARLQTAFGIWGIAMLELLYALIALLGGCAMVIAAKKTRQPGVDCIEIFSFRPPRIRHLFGGALLIGATYFASALYTNILYAFFPTLVESTAEALRKSFYAQNMPTVIAVMALLPAVCEELVFRGITQYALDRHGSARAAVLFTGLIFGLFHLDPVRIPIAVMTGVALSYALWRSRSIAIPMLMHFLNNASSAVLSSLADTIRMDEQTAETLAQIPERWLYLISAGETTVLVLICLSAGLALLEPDILASLKRHKITAVILGGTVLLLGVGYYLTAVLL
ncbi:MAG: CPBP family intramembrane metalloprotease [Clostridiales bacterium]|nr:CPBP family intramembrane metalloprotease [Clostridiales bacterium]